MCTVCVSIGITFKYENIILGRSRDSMIINDYFSMFAIKSNAACQY